MHQKPSAREVGACLPWLEAELAVIRPKILVCLGATATTALLGRSFRLTAHRGELLRSELAEHVTATEHPSSILRTRSEDERHARLERFIADLRTVAAALADMKGARQRVAG